MQEKNNSQVNLPDLFFYLLGKWYWFALCIIICLGYTCYKYSKMPFVYRSDATVIIKDPSNTRFTAQLNNYNNLINHVSMSNEILQLKSRQLMGEVVKTLDADISYTVKDKLRSVELYDQSPVRLHLKRDEADMERFHLVLVPLTDSRIQLRADGHTLTVATGDTVSISGLSMVFSPTPSYQQYIGKEIIINKIPLSSAASAFLSKMRVVQTEDEGTILNLHLQDYSRRRATDIINTLVDKYNEDAVREKNRVAVNTAAFINERLGIIQSELGDVEGDLAQYKSSQKLMNVDEAASQYLGESRSYNAEIVKIETRERLAQYLREYLATAFTTYETVPANTGVDDPAIDAAIREYNELILQRDRLVRGSSPDAPAVKQVESIISPKRQNITAAIDNLLTALKSRKNEMARLEQESIRKFTTMPAKARELLSIERQQKIKESLYIFLLNKREENALTQAMADNNARMIDSPDATWNPIYPQRNKMLLVAFLIGLFVPAVILISALFMDNRIQGRRDLAGNDNLPFLSEIPALKKRGWSMKRNNKNRDKGTAEYNEPHTKVFKESMRMMCTNIDFMKPEGCTSPVLMTTSFNVGVGKSFITRNIAACLADAKKSVLIIDTDLRKRSISDWFGLRHQAIGLSNYLINKDIQAEDIIRKNIVEGVDFIPAGHTPPNPTEILSRSRFDELINQMRSKYDYILLDGTPVNMVADSFVIGRLVDMNLFIIRSGLSDKRQLPMLASLIDEGRLSNLSIILNGSDPKHSYGYTYGYGYGYGYGYEYSAS